MATDTKTKTGSKLGWFAGLYIASIVVVAGTVYGLKFLISWITGV